MVGLLRQQLKSDQKGYGLTLVLTTAVMTLGLLQGDGKGNVPSETVLSAFFSNLLSKKQPGSKAATTRPAAHTEAAAQLDKMEKKQTPKV